MRIALCGSGGTGKSTMARLIAKDLGLELPPSQSRAVLMELGLAEVQLDQQTLEQRYMIQRTMLERKVRLDHDYSNAVFDRTILDHFFYLQYYGAGAMDDATHRTTEKAVMAHMKIYDIVLYCPFYDWPDTSVDGLRREGRGYRFFCDRTMFGMLAGARLRFFRVPNSLPQHRLAWFKKIVLPTITHSLSEVSA